jgi:hypothetical protein
MASISELAKMYQQRVPTATTSKIGPRNTTVEDVRRVATYGRSGPSSNIRYTQLPHQQNPSNSATTKAPFRLSPGQASDVQSGVVGGPAYGYGEKYGNFPTRSDYLAAIEGGAFEAKELGELARLQYEQEVEKGASQFAPQIVSDLSRSASMAGVRPGALMSAEDRANLAQGYERVQEFGRTPEYEAIRGPINQLNRSKYQPLVIPDSQTGEQYNANDLMRTAYEAMLEGPTVDPGIQSAYAQMASEQNVNLPSVRPFTDFLGSPTVQAPLQTADLIAGTPLYEYARQIAESRYGMDPSQAAGLFTPAMDMAYQKEQDDFNRAQQGFDNRSTAQYIFDEYGPEQFASYQATIAEEAMFGSPSQQRAAQDAQVEAEEFMDDMIILENYGFRPSDIPGVPAATIREAFRDENFQTAVDQISAGFAEQGGIPREAAIQIIDNYIATGSPQGPVNAQVLQRIISTLNTDTGNFDFE